MAAADLHPSPATPCACAVAGVEEASSQKALEEMQQAGAVLLSGAQLLQVWEAGPPASEAQAEGGKAAAEGGKAAVAAQPARLPAEL